MSLWTHINGTITIDAIGRTQAEKRYILDTILTHLPIVSGSEDDMHTYLIQTDGNNHICGTDEFDLFTNYQTDEYGHRDRCSPGCGGLQMQDNYILVVDGDFRDRMFDQTFHEFTKWLCRLAKRAYIKDVLVKLTSDDKDDYLFTNQNHAFSDMFEYPSWTYGNTTGEPAWYEYLMWQGTEYGLPRLLAHKYVKDDANDKLVQQWCRKKIE